MLRLSLFLLPFVLSASEFDLNACRSCHPAIVSEFEGSMHARSSAKADPFFAAMLQKAPDKGSCRECHAPEQKSAEGATGMSCLSCHRIESVEKHAAQNRNRYREAKDKRLFSAEAGREKELVKYHIESSWFGLSKKKIGSPYHDIDYRNPIYYSGEVCMGCHSHKVNGHGVDLCRNGAEGAKAGEPNCISCHMPRVPGSATTIRQSATHAWHGAAGVHEGAQMLARYIDLSITPAEGGFIVSLGNETPHPLLTHPARQLELRVTIHHQGKERKLKPVIMQRVLGREGKPTPPWLATELLSDTIPGAQSTKRFPYRTALEPGDRIEAVLGVRALSPKLAEKLGLNADEAKFVELKRSVLRVGSQEASSQVR
ncbi:multiheme c-type cytochrome [Nitratifractor sp.]